MNRKGFRFVDRAIVMILLCGMSSQVFTQRVAINTDGSSAHSSSILDIKSTTRGLLIPRMTQAQRNAITTPASGLMIYQTNGTPGFYFYNGSAWQQVGGSSTGWSLTGNSGTDPTLHFIGTSDDQPLRFRINNKWAGEINRTYGNVYLGDSTGSAFLSALNTAIGHKCFSTGEGGSTTAVGAFALHFNTASHNTAIGTGAMLHNIDGFNNTAVGSYAMFNNISGEMSIAIGKDALYYYESGWNNTAVGPSALANIDTSYNNTALGAISLFQLEEGSDNTAVGSAALSNALNVEENTAVGALALYSNVSGNYNTAFGAYALTDVGSGIANTALGRHALYHATGSYNTAVGEQALLNTSSGTYNVAVGQRAGRDNNTGSENVAIGAWAHQYCQSGSSNVAIGSESLYNNVSGAYNIAIGRGSGTSTSLTNTVSIGNHGAGNAGSNQVLMGNFSTTWNGGNVGWSTFSDARVKKNITENVKGLDFIMRLRPVTYHRDVNTQAELTGNQPIEDYPGKYDIEQIKFSGFLAQEVEQAAAESGYDFSGVTLPKSSHEVYTLTYEAFVVPLVKGMQEQQKKIEMLEQTIKDLLLSGEKMLNEISELKKQVSNHE